MTEDIERLVAEIESSADPGTRERVRALVAAVLELHAAALARILELAGDERVRELAAEPSVAGVLILHGLHPLPLEERARVALAAAGTELAGHRVAAELIAVEGGRVRVLVTRTGGGACGSAVTARVEELLLAAVPDAAAIVVEDPAATAAIARLVGRR